MIHELEDVKNFLKKGFWEWLEPNNLDRETKFSSSNITFTLDGPTSLLDANGDGSYIYGTPLDEQTKQLIREIITEISEQTGIQFIETSEYGAAQIRFSELTGTAADDPNRGGASKKEYLSDAYEYSLIAFNRSWIDNRSNNELEHAIIHEIGHALGLGHTGRYNGNNQEEDPTQDPYTTMHSIMSYNHDFTYTDETWNGERYHYYSDTLSALDILTLQELYGTQRTTPLNDADGSVYTFTGAWEPTNHLIIDDGGNDDTIDASLITFDTEIDLRPGSFSALHQHLPNNLNIFHDSVAYLVQIDYNTIIENIKAGQGNDTLYGNQANNRIEAGAGDDTVYGFKGADTFIAGIGDNFIDGGTSTSLIDGIDVEDQDSIDYSTLTHSTGINLLTHDTHTTVTFAPWVDTLQHIEHITLSHLDDTIELTDLTDWSHLVHLDGGANALGEGDSLNAALTISDWQVTIDADIAVSNAHGGATFSNFETLYLGGGDDTITIASSAINNLVIHGTGPNDPTTDTDTLIFTNDVIRTFHLNDAYTQRASTDAGNLLFFRDIERIETNTLAFSFEETTDQDMVVDFSDFDGRILSRNNGIIETIGESSSSSWIYSGTTATILGADHIIGTANADAIQGGHGQHIEGGAGNDFMDLQYGDRATLGEGTDIVRWIYSFATDRTADGPQVVTDFSADDTLIFNGMSALNVSFVNTQDGALFTHNNGPQLLLEGVTGEIVMQNAIFQDGSMWVGSTLDDTRNISSWNSGQVMYGLYGTDRLTGSNGTDRLYGGDDRDYLYGGNGNDYLFGDEGNDLIYGGDSNDHLYGGDGNDYIVGGKGWDILYGGDGNDHLRPYDNSDQYSNGNDVYGGDGSDFFHGSRTNVGNIRWDSFVGGKGRDIFYIPDSGAYSYWGGKRQPHHRFNDFDHTEDLILLGKDTSSVTRYGQQVVQVGNHVQIGYNDNRLILNTTVAEVRDALIWLNANNDYNEAIAIWNDIKADGTREWLGNDNDNTLTGRDGADALYGRGGNDTLNGRGGDDVIYAGSGNDRVYAGAGDDEIHALGGQNTVYGGTGDDWVDGRTHDGTDSLTAHGEDGNDILLGSTGSDMLYGGNGDDLIEASVGQDVLYGGAGHDDLHGQGSNDTLYGDDGNDLLNGGSGDDALYGGSGDDTLEGFTGNDQLTGGAGNDQLTGGDGSDTFIFNPTDGQDTITDFTAGEDTLEFTLDTAMSETDFLATYVSYTAADTLIDFGNGNSVTLTGIMTLTVDDFSLA